MGYGLGPGEKPAGRKAQKTTLRYQIVEVSLHEESQPRVICAYAANEFEAACQHADRLAAFAKLRGDDPGGFQVKDLLDQRSPYIGQAPVDKKGL